MRGPAVARFWVKVEKDPGGCWLWMGSRTRPSPRGTSGTYGYGEFFSSKGKVRAHRFSWMLLHGRIPRGRWVLHRCDNPPCVNPAHLFLGNAKDNAIDRMTKGRGGSWKNSGANSFSSRHPERLARGEHNGRAKLAVEDVAAIRRSTESPKELAARFGVSVSQIYRVRSGRQWSGGAA